MGLMYKSNAPLLEWLSSPIIYKQNEEFIKDLRDIAEKYFSPVSVTYHYINIAKKSFGRLLDMDNVKLKKLFYIIRPILSCMWMETYNTIPPMNLQSMMKKIEIDSKIKAIVDELIIVKADSIESGTVKPQLELIEFLKEKLEYYDSYVKGIKNEKERNPGILNEFFQKTLRDYYGGIL